MTNFKKSDVIIHVPNQLDVRGSTNPGTGATIGAQFRPGYETSIAQDLIGVEIIPRLESGVALNSSKSLIGLRVVPYLKGTGQHTGNIAGDMMAIQTELNVQGGISARVVSGDAMHIKIYEGFGIQSVTGKYSAIRLVNPAGKLFDAMFQVAAGSGAMLDSAGTTGGTQNRAMKIIVGTTTYYIPLYTTVS